MHITATHRQDRTRRRHPRHVVAVAAATAVLLVATGCTQDWGPGSWNAVLPAADEVVELRAADGCGELVASARPTLERTVDAMWPDRGWSWFGSGDEESATNDAGASGSVQADGSGSTAAPAPAAGTAQPGAEAGDGSGRASVVIGTNNQEAAVEESDLVKTDGRRIVSLVNGALRVVQLDGSPTIDGSLDLTPRGATDLFLRGDTVLVLGTTYGDGGVMPYEGNGVALAAPEPTTSDTTVPDTTVPDTTVPGSSTTVPETTTTTTAPTTTTTTTTPTTTTTVPLTLPPFPVATTLTLVSLADPIRPTVVGTAEVEGSMVTAREFDGRARIVVQSNPTGAADIAAASSREAADQAIDRLDGADLLPRATVDGRVEPLGSCDDVFLAEATSSPPGGDDGMATSDMATSDMVGGGYGAPIDTVTVLTVGDDLGDLDPVSIQGAANTVYASTESLYVAEGSWDESGSRTNIHRFSLAGDGPATYTGSGLAPGHLLNQFALSERDGALRVVTTLDGAALGGPAVDPAMSEMAPASMSSARLTVLDTDGTLDEIGNVDGMGIGETVHSVRFLDDLVYLVTFRQVDPLYAVDLSDPRAPRLLGELKIPGFSEYLHPVGEGLLLGVGREVDPDTGIDEGLKISLFDVSDPAQMVEQDQIVLPQASSPVGSDHRAFLWDPVRSHAVIPAELSCGLAPDCTGGGGTALVVRAGPAGLDDVGRVTHRTPGGWTLAPLRSVVVDDDLWTVSMGAIGRTDAARPGPMELLPY